MNVENQFNLSAYTERTMNYKDEGYSYHFDIFFMKNLYRSFRFMKISKFIELVRFLSRVS